jgi:hypothetical protein
VWNAYVIFLAYLVAIIVISAAVQFTLFQITCLANLTDLPLRLHRKALSRAKLLWPLVAWFSLFFMDRERLLPALGGLSIVAIVCVDSLRKFDAKCSRYHCDGSCRLAKRIAVPFALLQPITHRTIDVHFVHQSAL